MALRKSVFLGWSFISLFLFLAFMLLLLWICRVFIRTLLVEPFLAVFAFILNLLLVLDFLSNCFKFLAFFDLSLAFSRDVSY